MASAKLLQFLDKARATIAGKVRQLRLDRGLSQQQLANEIGLSQNRLSEIERGGGSFSAEQLLLLLQFFNVSVSAFLDQPNVAVASLQNALARHGAPQLTESSTVLPSEQLDDLATVVREALVDGSPRFIISLAPLVLRQSPNLRLIQSELTGLGFEHRLPWLVENTLEALRIADVPSRLAHTGPLSLFLDYFAAHFHPGDVSKPPDILDAAIRSSKTVDQVLRKGSEISRRWRIVTALTPNDFVDPLKVALVAN